MRSSAEKYFAIIPVILLCVFYIVKAVGFELHDFANYYFGGYFLRENHFTSEIYFPYWFNKEIVALGSAPLFAGFAPNSPFLAMLFVPFSFLSGAAAKVVFNIISLSLFGGSLLRLVSFYKVNPIYLLFIPILFFVPLRNEILFGQVYFLLFFFLCEFWLAYEKKHFPAAALFLSLGILLKVFPILLLLIFLFRKQYKPFVYTILCCLALAGFTMIFCGFDIWVFYIKNVLTKASAGGIASAYVENYQSLFMFLKRLLVFDPTQNPGGFNQQLLFSGLMLAFKVKLVAIGFYVTRKVSDQLLVFSYWILACILISPYGSTYTFILLLFPFFVVAKSDMPNVKKAVFLFLLFLINNFPLSLFIAFPFPFSYWRLFALLAVFSLLLTMFYQNINLKMVSFVALASLGLALYFGVSKTANSSYFLDKSPLLIYDYSIDNNRLTYNYWNQNGENNTSITLQASTIVPADLIRNEIYYYGKKIAAGNGNKLKPIVIDGKTLLYLSDEDRGIGFFTLRKLVLEP